MNQQDRTLLQALRDFTAEPSPLTEIASRVKKALTPAPAFDATAWAASVVKVRPGKRGGTEVVIGGIVEHWTGATEARASAARLREALIASLPEHLVRR